MPGPAALDPHTAALLLYREHHPWLLQRLRRTLGCPHQAADLAHDTFVRVLGRPSLPGDLLQPRAWLGTIAHGLLVDFLRRADLERAYLQALAALPASHHPSAEDRALTLEALRQVDRLLDGLSSRARAAYLWSRLDGLPHAEIAQRLGVSAPRVRQYLATAARRCYELRYG
ncbi:MAG: sigma-70 family RNA polymerase sigma factor [Pseudomonadota bacterium]